MNSAAAGFTDFIGGGRQSPLFNCLDYASEMFGGGGDDGVADIKATTNRHHHHHHHHHDVKAEASPPAAWPPPAYGAVTAVSYGGAGSTTIAQQQRGVTMRPPASNSVPGSPMFIQPQQSSPAAMPADSTSFLQFGGGGGGFRDHRRASDGDLLYDGNGSSTGYYDGVGGGYIGGGGGSSSSSSIGGGFVDGGGGGHTTDSYGVPADSSASIVGINSQQQNLLTTGTGGGSQKAFVPCKVCGDKASGYHYGVTSCEGCKGFFRRSIQKQIEYRCLRDGKCMVFRLNRNRCQYCRFKKCLAVGMSRDSVRYGRVPKRSRERMQDETLVTSMTGESEMVDTELEKRQLALYDIILGVSQAHHANCNYTDDKIKNLALRPMHFPLDHLHMSDAEPMSSTELHEEQKIIMWQTMGGKVLPEIQHVVEFAKKIPGFADLEQADQLVLIKCGFFEMWLVRVSRMFNSQTCSLAFSDGSLVSRDQLEIIYNTELTNAMASFTSSFNNLHLNDGEIGLFSAVVLLSQDRPRLKSMPRVELLQEQLLDALKLQLTRSHSSDPQLFSNLLMKLTELRAVGAKHREVLEWFQMNSSRLRLPALYAEIYNIHDERSTLAAAADECNRHQQQQQQPPPPHHQFVVLPPPPPYYPAV